MCSSPAFAAVIDVGTGYTYSTIQSGINSAVTGDSVHVHAGTYTISSPIVMKSGVTVYGDGASSTIIYCPSWVYCNSAAEPAYVFFSGVSYSEICGFTIKGPAISESDQWDHAPTNYRNAVWVAGSSHIKIHDINMTLLAADGVKGQSPATSYVDVYNCDMSCHDHDGVQIWSGNYWNVSNCYIKIINNCGVRFADTSNSQCVHTTITNGYGTSGWTGIELENTFTNILVTKCVFIDMPGNFWAATHDPVAGSTANLSDNIVCNVSDGYSFGGGTITHDHIYTYTETHPWGVWGYGYVYPGSMPVPVTDTRYSGTPVTALIYPMDGDTLSTINGNLDFSWSNVNSTSYHLYVYNSTSVHDATTLAYEYTGAYNGKSVALGNGSYSWKVSTYVDTLGTWASTDYNTFTIINDTTIGVYNGTPSPETIYPAAGQALSYTGTPITFTWKNVNSTQYYLRVYNSTSVHDATTRVINTVVTGTYKTETLSSSEYSWVISAYDDADALWVYSDYATFSLSAATESRAVSVDGFVYETELNNPIKGAVVTLMNSSWSSTYVTTENGYYSFPVVSNTGQYWLSVSATDYQSTQYQLPINVTDYTRENVALTKSPSYFAPHYVTFTVMNQYGQPLDGATINIYEGEVTTGNTFFSGNVTSASQSVTLEMDEARLYTIVVNYGNTTETKTVYPISTQYYIFLNIAEEIDNSQLSDSVTINVSKNVVNDTAATITVNYTDIESQTTDVYFELCQRSNNGTLSVIGVTGTKDYWTSGEFINHTATDTFTVTGYLGQTYIVRVSANNTKFGSITNRYAVPFAGSNLPFKNNIGISLCAVFILLILASQFGKFEQKIAPLIICAFASIMWYTDLFTGFDTWKAGTNNMILATLVIAVVYSIMNYIKTEE
jgi:hypothetical protein